MGCATGTIKYSLLVFNILLAILAILGLILGSLVSTDLKVMGFLICSAFLLLMSLFGIFGAIHKIPCLLWAYVIFIIVFFAVSTSVELMTPSTDDRDFVDDAWTKVKKNPDVMNEIQRKYSCCGFNSSDDYLKLDLRIPASCCKDKNCLDGPNHVGCLQKVKESNRWISYADYSIMGIMLVAIVLASILAVQYTKQRRHNY